LQSKQMKFIFFKQEEIKKPVQETSDEAKLANVIKFMQKGQ